MGPTVSLGWRPPTSQPPPQWKRVQSSRRPIRAGCMACDWRAEVPVAAMVAPDTSTRHLSRPHAPVLLHRGLHRKAAGTQHLANLRRHLPHIVLGEIVHRRDGCLALVAACRTRPACCRSKPPLPLPRRARPHPGLDANAVYATPHLLLFLFERCASDAVTDPG